MEKRFLIVGLGLLGGRYAMGLARAGFAVDGADTDPAAVAYALEKGYIRQGRCGDHADLAREADVVVCGAGSGAADFAAIQRRAGKDPYRAHDRLSEYVGQVESLDRRQFLNCVLDSLQRHFD